jgi:hypothetical protein
MAAPLLMHIEIPLCQTTSLLFASIIDVPFGVRYIILTRIVSLSISISKYVTVSFERLGAKI